MERKRIAGWTPAQAARTWEATEAYERSLGSSAPRLDDLPGERGILFRNDSGEEIPAYGLMHITGCVDDKFNYVTVDKPATANLIRSKILINGPTAVPDGEEGTAQTGPIFRLIHDDAISYQAGDRVGYKDGSFLAGLNPTFLVLGEDDIEENCLRVMFDDTEIFGVSASTITSSTAGNVTVISPYAPTTRVHKAKTIGSSITSGSNVRMGSAAGEWIVLEVC
jgi:hypothetical protein